jgi:DNA-directed RNA polymerase subunit K/omega
MGIPLDEILGMDGNKYEKAAAMIKYTRYLTQKNDDALEVHVGGGRYEKLTLVAMRDILKNTIKYDVDYVEDTDD